MQAPDIILELIERFNNNLPSYKSGQYNEAQVRLEFINPFFEALGWDIYNKRSYAEAYKEVIHEYSQKTLASVKAPDYAFRIGGQLKFFVEAKKPGVNIKDDIHPAYQLRRYAWSSKLPLSILTDFEELAVYDCRIPPKPGDKASIARINFIPYSEYIDRWDELLDIFSPEAIKKGSFDRYASSTKNKRGTAEVDEKFLDVLKEWRELLARNIALRNPSISTRELNYAVQKTIDRIIFLRICEDRGIEEYGQLQALQNGSNIYKRLLQLFTRADEKYNSGLFHFEEEKQRNEAPDCVTPGIDIDDKLLKDIFKNLYYPHSPFEFSVLPADILGQVYEQFLGKVIRLTDGHQAKIEDKPEVKKAGGVYYTPTYIVDYIVDNTLGIILEKAKTPKEVSVVKVLDPACGSGSFLIVAYQRLLDWHLKYYSLEDNINVSVKNNCIYKTPVETYRLTTSERKRILLNNIFGVDIDSQAVEVTKLSLLLKVLEGETEQSLSHQINLFKQRALPDLGSNIKCGNSLIGPDFYDQMEMNFLEDEEKMRINVFNWKNEFKGIMDKGGFDVVIGNPPYYGRASGFSNEEKKYLHDHFVSLEGKYEIYHLFIEQSLNLLNKNGIHSFITPQTWLSIIQAKKLREFIINDFVLSMVLYSHKKIFKVSVDNIIYCVTKNKNISSTDIYIYRDDFKENTKHPYISISTNNIFQGDDLIINLFQNTNTDIILNKIKSKCLELENICHVKDGIKIVGPAKEFAFSKKRIDSSFHPMLIGKDIDNYKINWGGLYCCRDKAKIEKHKIIDIRLREEFIFKRPKIVIRKTGNSIISAIDYNNFYYEQSLFSISLKEFNSIYSLELIAGIFNSKLALYLLKTNPFSYKETFPQLRLHWLKEFPLPKIDAPYLSHIEKINTLVKIIQERSQYIESKNTVERDIRKREIDSIRKQIDKSVYQFYGLNVEEIKLVEGI